MREKEDATGDLYPSIQLPPQSQETEYAKMNKKIKSSKKSASPDRVLENVERVLHDDGGSVDILLDRLVGQDGTAIDVNLIANGDVVTENSDILQTRPLANSAVPANNGRLDPGMVLDAAVLEQHTPLQADTITNDNVGANCDIGTNTAVLANFG